MNASLPALTFSRLKKNLKGDYSGFSRVRLAILGDSPTQLLHQALRGYGFEVRLDYEIFEADFDQIDRQILDPTSEIYQAKPEFVLVFESTRKLYEKFAGSDEGRRAAFAADRVERVRRLHDRLVEGGCGKVLWCNFPERGSDIFGSFANKTELSFTYQLRRLNLELMNLAIQRPDFFLCDLASLQNALGIERMVSPTMYVNTGMVLSLESWVPFAQSVTGIVLSAKGRSRKCLILDLDNTVWGGVIGDDGVEGIQIGELGIGRAFTEIQRWAKLLKERGILLAVCSKNDEAIAKVPFEKHPEMVLRLSDLAVFVASWENKVDGIRHIQRILNIGMDSIVFVDDSAFERNMVRSAIPELCVPELPEDPSDYAPFLESLNLFEVTSFSNEDRLRTRQYQEEATRASFEKSFANEDEYLSSLLMRSSVKRFDRFETPRIAQLTQRSNQFNLRTIRYTEGDIEAMRNDPDCVGLSFTLSDRFGDYGLISVVILRRIAPDAALLDTWLMSCRVLKRGMEQHVLNSVVLAARQAGFGRIVGEYLPTPKNGMVKDHYERLGFRPFGSQWELSVESFDPRHVHITSEALDG